MSELSKRIYTSIILLTILFFALNNLFFFTILFLIIIYQIQVEFNYLFKRIFIKNKFKYFLIFIFSFTYLLTFTLIVLKYLSSNFYTSSHLIVFLILICISTDIGGFLFGKLIGGKKITKISPNKTYSGACGSFILPIIAGTLYFYKFNNLSIENINIFLLIILISFFSQLGDLGISFLKRKAKVKDTGHILPGHGGVLDRLDGILLAIPISIIIIYLF